MEVSYMSNVKINKNRNLHSAKRAKNDEFYTQLTDIEAELYHYRDHFKGKVIFCNCDDPYESNFFKYFALHFKSWGLKKLIATGYVDSPIIGTQLNLFDQAQASANTADAKIKHPPYAAIISSADDITPDFNIHRMDDIKRLLSSKNTCRKKLIGDGKYPPGDFRSEESLELLREADIVITNPPFSLFREYVALLMKYEKNFVILGNQNAITYKEFFPLLKDNKVWIGPSIHSGDRVFYVPDDYPLNAAGCGIDEKGKRFIKVKGVRWYTNLDIKQRHEDMILYKHYTPEEYPKYDNYDAINVDKVSEIPCDYDGVIGVPITFMDKYNPDQFEIIGSDYMVKEGLVPDIINPDWNGKLDRAYLKNKRMYSRILIKRKK